MSISQLTELLGWAAILNMAMLMVASVSLLLFKDRISAIHSKMFGLDKQELPALYFQYLANYKVLTLVFFMVPYFSLKLMGN